MGGGGLMRFVVSTALELAGVALVFWALYTLDWRIAVVVGGVMMVLVGFILDRPDPPADGVGG